MNQSPHISVIMPVYNCGSFVAESIESILGQTYTDFEFIIIDDHSTDNTLEIVKSFKDDRISVYEKEVNKGMVDSLNYGISIANGSLIARMDGDDYCHPSRFEKQLAVLKTNPHLDIVSTNAQILNTKLIYNYSKNPEKVKVDLLFGSAFVHASLMGKIEVFRKNPFNEKMKHAEDYDLWSRLAFIAQMANMKEVLYYYRAHENQVSKQFKKTQQKHCTMAQRRMFHYIPYDRFKFPDILLDKALRKENSNIKEAKIIFKWFDEVKIVNEKNDIYKKDFFNAAIEKFRIKYIKFSLDNLIEGKEPFSLLKTYFLLKERPTYIFGVIRRKITRKVISDG